MTESNLNLKRRRNSTLLILSIFIVQINSSVIIYHLSSISAFYLLWAVLYHIISFFFTIPQSSLSDNYGRKKLLLIACFVVLISSVYVFIITLIKKNYFDLSLMQSFSIFFPMCLILGMAGNANPIARAAIGDLKLHDFRTAMGWATTIIGFGWITGVFLGFILPPLGVLLITIFLQLINFILLKKHLSLPENPQSVIIHKKIFSLAVKSPYKWYRGVFFISGGAFAIFAYLFSEITFYQIYSLNENVINFNLKVVGILMAFGYAFGVLVQWITFISDKKAIRYGISISFISLILLLFCKYLFDNNTVTVTDNIHSSIDGFLEFFFAFGFGFTVPTLFCFMAKKQSDNLGKLFGIIDATDTFALMISYTTLFLGTKSKFLNQNIYIFSVCFFIISVIFYISYIKNYQSNEKPN